MVGSRLSSFRIEQMDCPPGVRIVVA
jgi:hypothetical protein